MLLDSAHYGTLQLIARYSVAHRDSVDPCARRRLTIEWRLAAGGRRPPAPLCGVVAEGRPCHFGVFCILYPIFGGSFLICV